MNNFGSILALILKLAVPTVLTVETVMGQAASGTDKKTMAATALDGATQAALSLFPAGSQNALYAQAASTFASAAIDATVDLTREGGQYQQASQAAAAAVATAK